MGSGGVGVVKKRQTPENIFPLRNAPPPPTRHTGNVKAEKNTFTKDGKNIPAEKAVDIR